MLEFLTFSQVPKPVFGAFSRGNIADQGAESESDQACPDTISALHPDCHWFPMPSGRLSKGKQRASEWAPYDHPSSLMGHETYEELVPGQGGIDPRLLQNDFAPAPPEPLDYPAGPTEYMAPAEAQHDTPALVPSTHVIRSAQIDYTNDYHDAQNQFHTSQVDSFVPSYPSSSGHES